MSSAVLRIDGNHFFVLGAVNVMAQETTIEFEDDGYLFQVYRANLYDWHLSVEGHGWVCMFHDPGAVWSEVYCFLRSVR